MLFLNAHKNSDYAKKDSALSSKNGRTNERENSVNTHKTVTFATRSKIKYSAMKRLDNWLLNIFYIVLHELKYRMHN